jgi:two-component system chemotaxis sensor kinase CheA
MAPLDVVASAVAAFPGAILLVDGAGIVTNAWASPATPVAMEGIVGRAIHAVLGLPADEAAAGQLQLWLACAVGVDSEMFQLALGDPPRHLPAVVGRGALDVDYGPIFDGFGVTSAVAVFVKTAAYDAGARPATVDAASPEQVERFFVEMQPLLEDCAAELTKLDADHEARHSIHRMFRAMHTVKGAARAAGLGPIADLAHDIETHLARLREPGHQIRTDELAIMRELLRQLGQQALVDAPLDAVVDAMASLYGAYRPAMARAEESFGAWQSRLRDAELGAAFSRAVQQLADVVEPFRMRALADQIGALIGLTANARAATRPERRLLAAIDLQLASLHTLVELYQSVYRDVRSCDNPTRVVRCLTIAAGADDAWNAVHAIASREGLASLARACANREEATGVVCLLEDLGGMFAPAPASLGSRALLAAAQRTLVEAAASLQGLTDRAPEVAAIAATIVATAERLTWLGLEDMVRRVRRQATTLASELGKQVELEVDAFGIVVPESTHRVIHETLLHAIRNAIDHGIETIDERRTAGKRAVGTMRVSVTESSSGVSLEIFDDGRGIDVERVRAKAVANALIESGAELSEAQLLDLIFAPGLSTTERVTGVSGRGVGMDVIRSLAEEQGGTATISSERGHWTRLHVRLPLVDRPKSARRLDRHDDGAMVRAAGVEHVTVARL